MSTPAPQPVRPAPDTRTLANALRALSMDAVQKANSGHPGMPMGMADVATVLYRDFLRFDPTDPQWPDRDRFVLSAGHGSMLLYALLHLTGYPDFPISQLQNFRQLGSRTAGHPEYGHGEGIETTTGPLGQGLATAVGMALAERVLNARFGNDLVDHFTYVIAGDGCLMEGVSHEAIDLAGHLKLSRLIVLFDDNEISIDGATALSTSCDQLKRFEAAGWGVARIDGHDPEAIHQAIAAAVADDRPSLIACRTVIGFGAPTKQGTAATHGAPLGDAEIAATREALGWTAAPFEIPQEIADAWTAIGARGAADRKAWQQRLAAAPEAVNQRFRATHGDAAPDARTQALAAIRAKFAGDRPKLATRVSSQQVIEALITADETILGGSADLSGSNGTMVKGTHRPVTAPQYDGSYLHYGVREFGMAAAMNGIALHRGLVPYGGTFLVFADYSRPAIRLAALMGVQVIHVLTHDSIGLGEDGPTHQPVEHLASFRAMPNCRVFRPCDAVETAEAWACAMAFTTGPSLLILSRQGLPTWERSGNDNQSAGGAYVLREAAGGARALTLLATGSEVVQAMEAAAVLEADGVPTAVVSMPCWEVFAARPAAEQEAVLGTAPRLAIEAACATGWHQWLRPGDRFMGMESFGASGPAGDLYAHFGLTTGHVVEAAKALLSAE